MKRSSWLVVGVIAVLAVVLIYMQAFTRPAPSEQEQINMLLDKGQTAIEKKDLKGIMSCISPRYSDSSGLTFDELRLQALQAIRAEGKYDVRLHDTTIRVNGDEATVTTGVSVSLITDTGGIAPLYSRSGDKPATLTLQREKTRRYKLIPVHAWKVTRIEGLPVEFVD